MRAVQIAWLIAGMLCLGCGRGDPAPDRAAQAPPERGVVGPAAVVGKPGYTISGMALGEGRLWVASWDQRGGVVWGLDQRSGDLLTTIRVAHGGGDVATGAGAVWTPGVVCLGPHPDDPDVCVTEPRVSRIDPRSGQVAATIEIALPRGIRRDTAHVSGVAVGEGAVWVAVSWTPWAGEIVRIDPSTNAIAARVATGGSVGELRLGAGSVWALSHPEYTDETNVKGASLLRIDPSTNAVVATPIREELSFLGGTDLIPPVMAAGDDAVWITSPTAAHPRLALRVDTHANQVARVRLPVERFYPIAVEDDAVWFTGTAGRSATLARLDPRTLRQTSVTKLPISAVRAVHDPSTDSFWIGSRVDRSNERVQLVRVEMQ